VRSFLSILAGGALLGASAGAVTVDWVTVGAPGNAADTEVMAIDGTTGYGAVGYTYRISKYEVTNAEYVEFLTAMAATDPNGLYSTSMADDLIVGGITRSGVSGSFSYSVKPGFADKPVSYVSFWDVLRFVNWVHNGQPAGAQDATTTEDGAYTLTAQGMANNTIARNAGATIFLPSNDEWYKAAYYDAGTSTYVDYATGTDVTPRCRLPALDTGNEANCNGIVGGLSDVGAYALSDGLNGLFDLGGNAWEWTEGIVTGNRRALRGGSWNRGVVALAAWIEDVHLPTDENDHFGFRVASPAPPPCSNGLDDDGDGLVDLDDPGCADPSDLDEHDPLVACDDGADNDDDHRTDLVDPGCRDVLYLRENPQCQDGLDNDGQAGIDFDGGASLDLDPVDGLIDAEYNPATPAVTTADPQCASAWKNRESAAPRCGLGMELGLVLPLLLSLWQRRRGRTAKAVPPAAVGAGAPRSRPRVWGEIPGSKRGVESPQGVVGLLGGEQRCGPTEVNPCSPVT